MKKFRFTKTQKETVYRHVDFTVEASSKEEAEEIAKKYVTEDVYAADIKDPKINIVDEVIAFDGGGVMTPEENKGRATVTIYEGYELFQRNKIASNAD